MATRKVANIYEETRELLDRVKAEFEFKSDDQAIRYLCEMFVSDDRAKIVKQYLNAKRKKDAAEE